MSTWALGATVVLYGITALDLLLRGNAPMAGAFTAYAASNVFLLIATR